MIHYQYKTNSRSVWRPNPVTFRDGHRRRGWQGSRSPSFLLYFWKNGYPSLERNFYLVREWRVGRVAYALPQFPQSPGSAPGVVKITRQNTISCLSGNYQAVYTWKRATLNKKTVHQPKRKQTATTKSRVLTGWDKDSFKNQFRSQPDSQGIAC